MNESRAAEGATISARQFSFAHSDSCASNSTEGANKTFMPTRCKNEAFRAAPCGRNTVISDIDPVKPNLTRPVGCVVIAQCPPLPHAEQTGRRVHLVSSELFLFYKPDPLLFYSRCLHDLQGNLDRTKVKGGRKSGTVRGDNVGRHQTGLEEGDTFRFPEAQGAITRTVACGGTIYVSRGIVQSCDTRNTSSA